MSNRDYNDPRQPLEEILAVLKSYHEEGSEPFDETSPVQIGGQDFAHILDLTYEVQRLLNPQWKRNEVTPQLVEKWYGDLNGREAAQEVSPEEYGATAEYLNHNEYEAFDPMTVTTALHTLDVFRLTYGEHFKNFGIGPKEMFEEECPACRSKTCNHLIRGNN